MTNQFALIQNPSNNHKPQQLKLDGSTFRLPTLGRTVSHSMTPAALKN